MIMDMDCMAPILKKIKLDPLQDLIKRGYLTERNVGITEFLGTHQPFIGVLKHRFEDFVVHEIDKKGNVVILKNYDKPDDIIEAAKKEEQEEILKKEETIELVKIEQLKIDSNFKQTIDNYIESNFETKDYPLFNINDLTKEERGKIHLFLKQNYPNLFESRTENIDGKKFLKIVPQNLLNNRDNSRNQNYNNKKFNKWPSNRPSYVHFVLYKENLETVQVVNELARRLGSTTKNFTFAGSKDKRAICTQQFCAFKTNPIKIWQACEDFNFRSHHNIRLNVGHFHFQPEPLRLGDLSGNKFEIILRNIRLLDDYDNNNDDKKKFDFDLIEQALEFVKQNGFINYFGMQRFGSHRIDSHKLGILILRKEFKKLCEEILSEKPIDSRPYSKNKNPNNQNNEVSFNDAMRIWKETGDAHLAYKKLNYKFTIEGSLLRALTKVNPNDYHGALCLGLARNSRLLYLHAYQSYLWNRLASFRLEKFGPNLILGDLVFVGNNSDLTQQPDDDNQEEDDGEEDSIKDNDNNKINSIKANIPDEQIQVVTENNIKNFTIFDVVLPIIGVLSKFPENDLIKKFIETIMLEDNVTIEQFKSLNKQWCVNGSYRKLLVKPKDLKWNFLKYTDDNKSLIKNDLDFIKENKWSNNKNTNDNTNTQQTEFKSDLNNIQPDEKIALKLNVKLPTSSYATIFLREITKISSISLEQKPWQLLKQQQQQQEEEKKSEPDDGGGVDVSDNNKNNDQRPEPNNNSDNTDEPKKSIIEQ